MAKEPKPSRGMPRSLLYALIPGGFLLIVLILVLTGFWRQEVEDDAPTVVDPPAGVQEPAGAEEPAGAQEPAGPQE